MHKWLKAIVKPFHEVWSNLNSPIRFHNFWDKLSIRDIWFYRFILHRRILEKAGIQRLDFYSVFGNRWMTKVHKNSRGISVFYTGENVENFPAYKDHLLNQVNLSIGFEFIDSPNYLRFPLWILYFIQPEWGLDEIVGYVEKAYNNTIYTERPGFCCLVASHDRNGIRLKMLNAVSLLGSVDSVGKIYKNTDTLKTKFGDNKSAFLRQYKLNICPENSNTPGYVTEKLFQSLECGCIPLYWGSNNKPETDILNQDAIWFYSPESGNQDSIREKIIGLTNDPHIYRQWCAIPKFLPEAPQRINAYLDQLEKKLINTAQSKK